MSTQPYKEYAKLQEQIKSLEEKRDSLKVGILKFLEKEGTVKEWTSYGTFTQANRVSYTYSDKVTALVEKVKLAKVREEEKGIAKASVTTYLVFTPIK